MTHRAVTCILLATATVLMVGCGLPLLDLRDSLDLHRSSFHDRLRADEPLAREFLACLSRAHDEPAAPPDGVSTEEQRLSGLAYRPIHALVQRVQAMRPQAAESLQPLGSLFADGTLLLDRRLDLEQLRRVVELMRRWHTHIDFDEDALARDSSRFGQLLLAYNNAYFGDVRFVPDPAPSHGGVRGVRKVTAAGFVDRNGNVWVFPGLSGDTPEKPGGMIMALTSSPNSQRISADLTRVFFEAFFDAAFRTPAINGATALQIEWKSSVPPYPKFDADHPPIPIDALARVTRDALRAEAAVTSLVGQAVRGGSVFAGNNETVAAMMETAAGVIAKKLVEHEGLCYFQVTQGRSEPGKLRHSSLVIRQP